MSQEMWASGFSLTTVNSGSSKTNEEGHAGMRLLTGLIRPTYSIGVTSSVIFYSSSVFKGLAFFSQKFQEPE